MTLFGVRLLGFTRENLFKLLLTIAFVGLVIAVRAGVLAVYRRARGARAHERVLFWIRQVSALVATLLILLAVVSIWFDNPARLATPMALLTAGLAFALQKVITAFAGYLVIMRGKTFRVGDRVAFGGVRGDVIALGFLQTTIMEMGQPTEIAERPPPTWVHGRLFTGRIVTVSNDKIFDEPVYNYTREFPFLWEEIRVPIDYRDDRARAEEILLRVVDQETARFREMSLDERRVLERRYFLDLSEIEPRVFYRLTDDGLELSVRFLVREHGIRPVKDRITRRLLDELEAEGIGIASTAQRIVGLPPLRIEPATLERLARALGARIADDGPGRPSDAG